MKAKELLQKLGQLSEEELEKPVYFYCLQDYDESSIVSVECLDLHISDRIDIQGVT